MHPEHQLRAALCWHPHACNRYTPYAPGKVTKCKVCKSTLHQAGIYCHNCAYSKG